MRIYSGQVVSVLLCTLLATTASAQQTKKTDSDSAAKPRSHPNYKLSNPETIAKPTGYSHVAEINGGKIVYIAGQVALDRSGNLVGKDDFRAQVQQVFENLKSAVEATHGNFSNVVKLNYYCAETVDASQLPALREIRDKYVNTAEPPTSTLVFVKRLVRPELMLEVDAVAVVEK
jgi:enamine deaminase RidA (YjgF/YER057c/UK114 family)